MKPRYLFRIDDAAPTMHRQNWAFVENLFDEYGVKPIVAVVPHNEDAALMLDAPNPLFWEKVRQWQAKKWAIALHGYNHVFTTREYGLLRINPYSEFAGVAPGIQQEKIVRGLKIMSENGVEPTVWVAPAHSFDETTLRCLLEYSSIRIISDGYGYKPFSDKGFYWLPQQLSVPKAVGAGFWTFCLHPNHLSAGQLEQLKNFLAQHHRHILSVDEVELNDLPQKSLSNKLFARLLEEYIRFRAWSKGKHRKKALTA